MPGWRLRSSRTVRLQDWYLYKGGYIAAMGQYWRARKELRQELVELLAARAYQLASITLLSRIVNFLRECGVAVGTMSGRSQQPRPDRFQDFLQRQTRSFFLPQGRWSG